MKTDVRARVVERCIRLTVDSLQSHLTHTYNDRKSKKKQELIGPAAFHRKCVKEYSEVIFLLSHLY